MTSIKRFTVLLAATALFSCNSNKEEEMEEEEIVIEDSSSTETPTLVFNPNSKLYVWRTTADYKKKKNEEALPAIINTDSLIKGLNEYYEDVFLEKVKQGNDTLYTSIKDSKYLTQQMGTTGAEMYLADVVLNLTAVPGIKYVKIDMEAGDHAQPGTWSADNFKNYKQVIQ
ncbi:MAG: hypothetical protein EOO13_11070 [Chitinophagaceae bacterium]|nr:MAG: hypothetical protein EOO13_11070 [Chitinophagaceae bacterium]